MILYCNGKEIDIEKSQNGINKQTITLTPSESDYYYTASPSYYPVSTTTVTKVSGKGTAYELPTDIVGRGFAIKVDGMSTAYSLYCEDENGNVTTDGVFASTPSNVNGVIQTHIFFTKNTAKRIVTRGHYTENVVSFEYVGESTMFTVPTSHEHQGGATDLSEARMIRRISSDKWYIVPFDNEKDTSESFKFAYCYGDDLGRSVEKTTDWLGLYTDLDGSGVFYAEEDGWTYTTTKNAPPIIDAKKSCLLIGDSFAMNQSQIGGKMSVNGIATKTFAISGGTAETLNRSIWSGLSNQYIPYKSWDVYLDENIEKFTDIIIELGMNKGTGDLSTNWEEYKPLTKGCVYDIINGGSVVVGTETIGTIKDYYEKFSVNTYGQKAFMIEMIQAYIRKHNCNTRLWLLNYGHVNARYNGETMIRGVENWCGWNDEVNAKLSLEYGVRVIPVYGLGVSNYEENTYDGTHPNWKGSKLYAKCIADALYKVEVQ